MLCCVRVDFGDSKGHIVACMVACYMSGPICWLLFVECVSLLRLLFLWGCGLSVVLVPRSRGGACVISWLLQVDPVDAPASPVPSWAVAYRLLSCLATACWFHALLLCRSTLTCLFPLLILCGFTAVPLHGEWPNDAVREFAIGVLL